MNVIGAGAGAVFCTMCDGARGGVIVVFGFIICGAVFIFKPILGIGLDIIGLRAGGVGV